MLKKIVSLGSEIISTVIDAIKNIDYANLSEEIKDWIAKHDDLPYPGEAPFKAGFIYDRAAKKHIYISKKEVEIIEAINSKYVARLGLQDTRGDDNEYYIALLIKLKTQHIQIFSWLQDWLQLAIAKKIILTQAQIKRLHDAGFAIGN